ncbi:Hypothetical predicted protein [Pelobates cultripes]|uniref:Reverse transcriptase zinc-binding domain-containing protein n=1 Tax=Pelobates cultripes TaxID=61616 RepID=A0AAD1SF12_PELCU|nr:Hypothetical predicted protein [Pelobates cultripes]
MQPDLRRGCRPLTTFESLATSRTLQKKHITTFYNLLQAQDNEQIPTYTKAWENDLGITLTQSEWGKIFTNISKSSINTTIQESNYKRISRWHLAPTRSYRFSPNTSRVCWRCTTEIGSPGHLWWTCIIIQNYWEKICSLINIITGYELPTSPETLVFMLYPSPLAKSTRVLINHMLTAANGLIPTKWKQSNPPTIREWLAKVEAIRQMEELSHSLNGTYDKYVFAWSPWDKFIKDYKPDNMSTPT